MAMTDNVKAISRPKVRFCQFSDDARNEAELVEHCQDVPQANGPRIKEMIFLKKPVRIVDPTEPASICDKVTFSNNCNIDTLSHCDTNTHCVSGNTRNMPLSNKNSPKVESLMILHDANGTRNTKKSCKMLPLNENSQDDGLKNCTKSLEQKGKENKGILSKRTACSKNISETRTRNSQHVQSVTREKSKLSKGNNHVQKINVQDFKKPKMTKSQSAPSIMKKIKNSMVEGVILSTKPAPSRVLSHYKTVAKKSKISPVKKVVLRNVSGPKIKTSVGPGVFRKKQANTQASDANERCTVTLDVNVKDLAQPEYNSIMCTINKLKELEQQKLVTNINHLPSALKSFLNGKVSAALDFPLDETVYKNLVDLSIDETQLPSIVMRSKDPEPRQKDIVPKLSDFFVPEVTKEIYEAVHVKPRALKIDDNWNAFKISDRILEWKYSIDDIN